MKRLHVVILSFLLSTVLGRPQNGGITSDRFKRNLFKDKFTRDMIARKITDPFLDVLFEIDPDCSLLNVQWAPIISQGLEWVGSFLGGNEPGGSTLRPTVVPQDIDYNDDDINDLGGGKSRYK